MYVGMFGCLEHVQSADPRCKNCDAFLDVTIKRMAVLGKAQEVLEWTKAPIHDVIDSDWDEGYRAAVDTVRRMLEEAVTDLKAVE